MSLALFPLAGGRAGTIRVWIGIFGVQAAPAIQWTVDDAPAAPTTIRPLTSVRPPELVGAEKKRTFTGIFDFAATAGGGPASIVALADTGASDTLATRSIPARVPDDGTGRFNVLIASCYHFKTDPGGLVGSVARDLKEPFTPHLTILMGDQVYLDLPWPPKFPKESVAIAERFERDYVRNWRGPSGLLPLLKRAPTVMIPDDHEFWNNYPHAAPHIPATYRQSGRDRLEAAAVAMFDGFQRAPASQPALAHRIDVDPLSFFISDSRTSRDGDLAHALDPSVLVQLHSWVEDLREKGHYGIFVTGQSLFEGAAGPWKGFFADRRLADHEDYAPIVRELDLLAAAGRDVLCLTGDVHWGRVVRAEHQTAERGTLFELISSPSSLLDSSYNMDDLPEPDPDPPIGGGSEGEWPRHSKARKPPDYFGDGHLGKLYACSTLDATRGDQMTLLSFRRRDQRVAVEIRTYPVAPGGGGAVKSIEIILTP